MAQAVWEQSVLELSAKERLGRGRSEREEPAWSVAAVSEAFHSELGVLRARAAESDAVYRPFACLRHS